jgi:hypothetical protein
MAMDHRMGMAATMTADVLDVGIEIFDIRASRLSVI